MTQSVYDPTTQTSANAVAQQGSIESALAGNYSINLGELLSEAWQKTDGAKLPINVGFCIYFVAYLVAAVLIPVVLSGFTANLTPFAQLVGTLLNLLVGSTLMAGIMMMGVARVAGRPFGIDSTWQYLPKMLPIFLLMVVMSIMVMLGFILLILPGIYLSIAYMFAILLTVDRDMGVWEALETSRKAVTHHWFGVFGTMFVMGLLIFVSALPLGIGLIWTLPMCYVLLGLLYQRIFGVAA